MGLQVDPEMYREQASERLRKGGLTDGQSDALAHEFAGIRTDTDELKTDVSELKTDVSKLKTDVAEIKRDVAELKTDVSELKGEMDEALGSLARIEDHLFADRRPAGKDRA